MKVHMILYNLFKFLTHIAQIRKSFFIYFSRRFYLNYYLQGEFFF